MRWMFEWAATDTVPSPDAVAALAGLPPGQVPGPRVAALVQRAVGEYRTLAEPRALVAEVSHDEFACLYRGEGRPVPETPLDHIYPQAARLALFACTVGGRLGERIREAFAEGDPALGAVLDAVASAAADRLAELTGSRYLEHLDEAARRDWCVLPYSPGYCGWDVTGQRALFATLRPETIGIALNPSCLMDPLKSVSGVLVVGPPEIHIFRPAFAVCRPCRDRVCRDRMRRVRRATRPARARADVGAAEAAGRRLS